MADLIYKEEYYNIIGACLEIHKELGAGFLEAVYKEALGIELKKQKIPFDREKEIKIKYKGIDLNKKYIADFICYNKILIEVKALSQLSTDHESQLLNYLKATGLKLGILVNFGEKSLNHKRLVF